MEEEKITEIYYGPRDKTFKDFITKLLAYADMNDEYVEYLTNPENMIEYGKAFTSESVDSEDNYQVYEQLGDLDANRFIVWYMYRRFPKLICSKAVKIVARLRINYGSKQTFSVIANDLGFWPFVSATVEERETRMKPLLEDSFEAFLGATAFLLDKHTQNGVGSAIVYDILENIFNKIPISLKYEDLYDAKTRLKETFDFFDKTLEAKYVSVKGEDRITRTIVYMGSKQSKLIIKDEQNIIPRDWIEIGRGEKPAKADSEQAAASVGLNTLKYRKRWEKPIPELYAKFCEK